MRKNLLQALTVAAVCSCLAGRVSADVTVPDLSQKGSITVTVRDTEKKEPITEGTLAIYQVADARESDGDYYYEFLSEFSDCGYTLEQFDSPELAGRLADYAREEQLSPTVEDITEEGNVTFENLACGLYLITQYEENEAYTSLNPFLVSIPMKDEDVYLYDVDASPKVGTVEKKPEESETEPEKPTPPTPPGLPNTGQLWWPVPCLAFLGLVFVMIGFKLKRNS